MHLSRPGIWISSLLSPYSRGAPIALFISRLWQDCTHITRRTDPAWLSNNGRGLRSDHNRERGGEARGSRAGQKRNKKRRARRLRLLARLLLVARDSTFASLVRTITLIYVSGPGFHLLRTINYHQVWGIQAIGWETDGLGCWLFARCIRRLMVDREKDSIV